MTLTESLCGIPSEPCIHNQFLWIEWKKQRCPTLLHAEVLREWIARQVEVLTEVNGARINQAPHP